jgi:hypothetical protein
MDKLLRVVRIILDDGLILTVENALVVQLGVPNDLCVTSLVVLQLVKSEYTSSTSLSQKKKI